LFLTDFAPLRIIPGKALNGVSLWVFQWKGNQYCG